MLIALDDPIWTRLYGPYGIRDDPETVPDTLAALGRAWDEGRAADLLWEALHHQESLYPATYAALPHLWPLAAGAGATDLLPFLAHVVFCATLPDGAEGDAPSVGLYHGLTTDPAAHQWTWLAPEQRLRAEDRSVLEALEAWFTRTVPEIAEVCLGAIKGDDPCRDAQLLEGPAALQGGHEVAMAAVMWADGHDRPTILDERPATFERDRTVARDLAARLAPRSPDLAAFLTWWAEARQDEA